MSPSSPFKDYGKQKLKSGLPTSPVFSPELGYFPLAGSLIAHTSNQLMPDMHKDRIALSNGNGFMFRPIQELMYCVADGSYTRLYFYPDFKYLVTKSLGQLEALLSDSGFLRIHKSHLINMVYVEEVKNQSVHLVIMKNGEELNYSRNKKYEILDYFNKPSDGQAEDRLWAK